MCRKEYWRGREVSESGTENNYSQEKYMSTEQKIGHLRKKDESRHSKSKQINEL